MFPYHSFSQEIIQGGTIDLTSVNFDNEKPISLDGEWKFFWKKLIHPDSITSAENYTFRKFGKLWTKEESLSPQGFATYSLNLLLPQDQKLALSIPDYYSSYELFINGSLAARNGKVSTTKKGYEPKWFHQTVQLETQSDTANIVLHIANFDHSKGGAVHPIVIGSSYKLNQTHEIDVAYAYLLTGALIMGGLFFLGLYLFGRHETTLLLFSIFCIEYSYRIIATGNYPLHYLFQNIPWIVTVKLEYISLFLSGYLFGIYTLSLYPKETSKKLIYLLSGISLLFILIVLITPANIFTHLVTPYFSVIIVYIVYAVWVYTKAVVNKSPGAIFALASTGVIFSIFIYEMLVYFGFYEPFHLINFLGYVFFFFLQSLVLSYRFAFNLKAATLKAEESSLAKSQFLSTMSHEIRTPLNAVIGLSGLLSESDLNEKQKEFSNTIKLSGESLLSIINNILDYSKIESGKLELEHSEFNLRELVELVLDLVSSANKNKKVELSYLMMPSVPEFLVGDSTRIQQVLINLVANAIKFTETGDVSVQISLKEKHSKSLILQFDVKDTGIGIPEDRKHRLFQSFTQVDASSTRKYGGTGLGLVISKRLVEAMGGEISVVSEVERGSTFTFIIQLKPSARLDNTYKSILLDSTKIFVLDDNPINLEILTKQLEKTNAKIETFDHPSKILELIDTLNEYDFGVLDMQMPDHDGVEVAKEIRKRWDHKTLPLVLLSSIHELENSSQKELFDLYLTKPIKQTQLINNLERVFSVTEKSRTKDRIKNPDTLFPNSDLSILIAEDNLINQKVALKILERIGLTADIAANGELALQMVKTKSYDLVFMDMEMPIMDGIETTQNIREQKDSLPKIPIIIAMTANALSGDRERCLEAGMEDFISKPITTDSLKAILKKWFTDI